MYTILVADDDPVMLAMIEKLLYRDGYHIIKMSSASGVKATLESRDPDLLLLDINLPDQDGLSLCRDLREVEDYRGLPIVFLTGGAADAKDVAAALNAGGDDFIRKPFAARELSARIRVQLRRAQRNKANALPHLRLFPATKTIHLNNTPIALTRVEFNLLRQMCRKPNDWQTTRELLIRVWRYPGNVGDAALVRNHVRNLRRKIEPDPDRPTIVISRHRRGYMIAAQVEIVEEAVQ